jgi:hypothetical protein
MDASIVPAVMASNVASASLSSLWMLLDVSLHCASMSVVLACSSVACSARFIRFLALCWATAMVPWLGCLDALLIEVVGFGFPCCSPPEWWLLGEGSFGELSLGGSCGFGFWVVGPLPNFLVFFVTSFSVISPCSTSIFMSLGTLFLPIALSSMVSFWSVFLGMFCNWGIFSLLTSLSPS